MAVSTTPAQLYEAAYAKSTKNNPGQIATEATELLQLVIRVIRKFYAIAARVNPYYFSTKTAVIPPGVNSGWARPEGAESIFRLEKKTVESSTAGSGNVGDGTIAVSIAQDAQLGTYVLTCTAEAADAGTFKITDPAGTDIAVDVTVGVLHDTTDELRILISDGDEDFDIGDTFDIVVIDQEVVVVPVEDRNAEPDSPAVYRVGKAYYPSGNSLDPDPAYESLTFFYSKRPSTPATSAATIDTMWEEQFNELLILEIALYLAKKDAGTTGRDMEIAALKLDRDDWFRMFIMFLEHETVNERRRYGAPRVTFAESTVPLNDLLVGGTTVKIQRGGN